MGAGKEGGSQKEATVEPAGKRERDGASSCPSASRRQLLVFLVGMPKAMQWGLLEQVEAQPEADSLLRHDVACH